MKGVSYTKEAIQANVSGCHLWSVFKVKSSTPKAEPSHIVHFALRAEAAGQKIPKRKTQVIGGATWAMISLIPAKILSYRSSNGTSAIPTTKETKVAVRPMNTSLSSAV